MPKQKPVSRKILEQVVAATTEPLLVINVDQADWPVVLTNPAFGAVSDSDVLRKPFADVIEDIYGRELALEVSETVRSQQETSLPVESGGREFLLVLRPLRISGQENVQYYGAFWRSGTGASSGDGAELHHALLKAKRRIRDLSRDDPVTGLLNRESFADVFEHDWAVAARESGKLSLVTFALDDFDAYVEVFGTHAGDSCMRRVGRAIRRCLRRASDVVARPDGRRFVVLSHASDGDGVSDFAENIALAVRELGLHHPRASESKFVTVTYAVSVADVSEDGRSARDYLRDLLPTQA